MKQSELEQIVSMVTRQVLETIAQEALDCTPQTDGFTKLLAVGKAGQKLPEELTKDTVVYDLDDYKRHRNILRYDRVLITDLTITQLADIAQGRIGDETSCVVIHALLSGIDTLMLEEALSYRKFAGKGSTALYHLLESYAQTIQVFGVKPVRQKPRQTQSKAVPPKYAAPPAVAPAGSVVPNAGRLITEAAALLLVKEGRTVCLPADAIITPSARDVFVQAQVELVQEH